MRSRGLGMEAITSLASSKHKLVTKIIRVFLINSNSFLEWILIQTTKLALVLTLLLGVTNSPWRLLAVQQDPSPSPLVPFDGLALEYGLASSTIRFPNGTEWSGVTHRLVHHFTRHHDDWYNLSMAFSTVYQGQVYFFAWGEWLYSAGPRVLWYPNGTRLGETHLFYDTCLPPVPGAEYMVSNYSNEPKVGRVNRDTSVARCIIGTEQRGNLQLVSSFAVQWDRVVSSTRNETYRFYYEIETGIIVGFHNDLLGWPVYASWLPVAFLSGPSFNLVGFNIAFNDPEEESEPGGGSVSTGANFPWELFIVAVAGIAFLVVVVLIYKRRDTPKRFRNPDRR